MGKIEIKVGDLVCRRMVPEYAGGRGLVVARLAPDLLKVRWLTGEQRGKVTRETTRLVLLRDKVLWESR